MNKELNDLINAIKELDIVKEYQKMEKSINSNPLWCNKLNRLKELQKELIIKSNRQIEEEYHKLKTEIMDNPEVVKYLDYQNEVNALIQQITAQINYQINLKKD